MELDAGLRPGELFALHWPDVDFEAGAIFVRWSLEEISGKCRLKQPKTVASQRRILLAPRTLAALSAHRDAMLAEGKDVKDGLVFCGLEGGFLRISDVRRLSFLPIVQRAGLSPFRLYDLRHTVATLLLAADVNVVSERLGHESISSTLKHYAHALPSMQQRAAATIESISTDEPAKGGNARDSHPIATQIAKSGTKFTSQ